MNNQTVIDRNGKSLSAIIQELKTELSEFVQTRYQMLMAEMQEKATAWKVGIPLLAIALLMVLVAFLLLTGALVVVVALPLGVGWALFVVGLGYLILGFLVGLFGYKEIAANPPTPERTLRVLKQDQIWLQNEARSV